MKKVIIVGGGIGGLCTAVRLLAKGYKVKIIEKEKMLGGKVNILEEKGFKFDLTASILMTINSYTDIFKEAGRDYQKYFQLQKIEPIYTVNYSDGSSYKFFSDPLKMHNVLESMEEGLSKEYEKFLFDTLNNYLLAKQFILDIPMNFISNVSNLKFIKSVYRIKPLATSYKYISKQISNKKLKEYLLFQSMYIGINPYDNSSIYSIIPAITAEYGLYYIKGGVYKYVLALEKLIYELGGTIEKNTDVSQIIIKNRKVIGVKTDKETYMADIVVCNADYPYAVENLFKEDIQEKFYSKKNIENKKCSYSVFMIYLGLKKIYTNLSVHNIFINDNLIESFTEPVEGKFPENPSLYLYYPSAMDDSLCAKGKSVLNIMVRVPNLDHAEIIWSEKEKIKYRNKIMGIIKKINGLNDIEENIEFEEYLTPIDLKKKFNAYKGNAFGLSHKLLQSAYLRPHLKSKRIKGLYFIGSSTHPGNGISVIIDGSKVLTKLIEKYE